MASICVVISIILFRCLSGGAFKEIKMKKKYQVKKSKSSTKKKGAYDKDGKFWHEQDIKNSTGGLVKMCFGVEKEYILIIEV